MVAEPTVKAETMPRRVGNKISHYFINRTKR